MCHFNGKTWTIRNVWGWDWRKGWEFYLPLIGEKVSLSIDRVVLWFLNVLHECSKNKQKQQSEMKKNKPDNWWGKDPNEYHKYHWTF